jgi:hypothetical protein
LFRGDRWKETISTAFVESTINQVVSRRFVKKQQMSWTLKGAHLLLQTRTKVLNNELDEVFRRWYPKFRPVAQPSVSERKVACPPDLLLLSHAPSRIADRGLWPVEDAGSRRDHRPRARRFLPRCTPSELRAKT